MEYYITIARLFKIHINGCLVFENGTLEIIEIRLSSQHHRTQVPKLLPVGFSSLQAAGAGWKIPLTPEIPELNEGFNEKIWENQDMFCIVLQTIS